MKNNHIQPNGEWLHGYKEVALRIGCCRNAAIEIVRKCRIPIKRLSKRMLLFRIRDVDRCIKKYDLKKSSRKNK